MKILVCIGLFIISTFCFAQQNLFNIPSGQLTPEDKWFYQHQLNTYDIKNKSSKQHLAFGALKNFEIGLNFLNFNFLSSDKTGGREVLKTSPSEKIFAVTLQTQVVLTEILSINVGTQSGVTNLTESGVQYYSFKHYGLLTYFNDQEHLRLTGGAWVANKTFNGKGNYTGFMAGTEWMFYDGIYVMGDWISGKTKNSVSVVGGMVDIFKGFQVCLGYLIPNPKSTEGEGIVLELNLFEI